MKIEIEYMSMIYVLISVIKVFERLLGLTWKSVLGVVWGGGVVIISILRRDLYGFFSK